VFLASTASLLIYGFWHTMFSLSFPPLGIVLNIDKAFACSSFSLFKGLDFKLVVFGQSQIPSPHCTLSWFPLPLEIYGGNRQFSLTPTYVSQGGPCQLGSTVFLPNDFLTDDICSLGFLPGPPPPVISSALEALPQAFSQALSIG